MTITKGITNLYAYETHVKYQKPEDIQGRTPARS